MATSLLNNTYSKDNRYVISLQQLFVSLSIVYTILFPADKLNIKEIILLSALLICLPALVREKLTLNNIVVFIYGIVFPIITIIYSISIGDSTIGNALSYGYVWVFLLLVPAIVYYNIEVKIPFLLATIIVAGCINFIFITDLFGILSFESNPLLQFLANMNEIQYGKGIAATFGYSLFYKSCPLILFSYAYAIKAKKYYLALFFFVSLMGSGTRANFYSAIILTALVLVFDQEKKSKRFIAIVVLGSVALMIAPEIVERMSNLNSIKVNSDSLKSESIKSIIDHMNAAPYRYVFGSGVGSEFYNSGRGEYTTVVEVSYFDYFRQVGIIGFLLFSYFIVRPMKWLFVNARTVLFAYLAYLAVAFTNPLLVSSTAFMAYVLVLSNGMGKQRVSLMNKDIITNYHE